MPTTQPDAVLQLIDATLTHHGATTIETTHVPLIPGGLDSGGDPCIHCQESHIAMQAYYRVASQDRIVEGCAPCVIRHVAQEADYECVVQFETEVPVS